MAFLSWLKAKVRRLSRASQGEDRHTLLKLLCDAYRHQCENVASFTHHAEHMYYPQLREHLLRVVEEEQSHLQWLAQEITKLGGTIPRSAMSPRSGTNTWENLRLDLEEEQKDDEAFLHGLRVAERCDRELADGLACLRRDEPHHRQQLLDLWHKSEPDAVATPPPQPPEVQQQKRMWLAQQKMEWIEQRRSQWEADGKPIPWAEWLARREYEWTVSELPSRELHWTLQLTAQTATDTRVPRVANKW